MSFTVFVIQRGVGVSIGGRICKRLGFIEDIQDTAQGTRRLRSYPYTPTPSTSEWKLYYVSHSLADLVSRYARPRRAVTNDYDSENNLPDSLSSSF
jgi:hypothetical protein